MKKAFIMLFIFLLPSLLPAVGDASYIIHLKNGGRFLTPQYWEEDDYVKLSVAGGTMEIEKNTVLKIEQLPTEPYRDASIRLSEQPPALVKPVQETVVKGRKVDGEDKVVIEDHKKKKDLMTVELDGLLEKLREATRRKDNDAKEKIKNEIRAKSGQIYKLTDEVTEKNNGRLPEGWWGK
ncbi:MAG: hypothetical protein FJ122_08975 [Deltaproteobacteria bacterium]|nr:hypothetical protein [Deltaproteobacteria bacterium]